MEEINLTINGKPVICQADTTILEAAGQNNIKIPTLCHHHHLNPAGACRLCVVEDETSGRIFASCVTPVSQNMSIRTDTEELRKHRTFIIRLMMANHPESCILCNQGNRCELRRIAGDLGVGSIDLYPMPSYSGFEGANPFIIRDLSKCILCGRCIRADHDLVMAGAIDYNKRGFESRPATAHEMPLEKSVCTFCGTCISLCPTGALTARNSCYAGSPEREKHTICGFCGVGCSLQIGISYNRIVDVNPSHEKEKVNSSTLCVRGHFAHDFLNSPRRLTTPMIRKDGELVSVSWAEAIETVTENLLSIKKKYGPQSLGFYGSSKCSVEENYLLQKIARVSLETNNLDNGGTLLGQSVVSRFFGRLGGGGRLSPLKSIEKADAIFILGANPSHSMPVLSYFIKRGSRQGNIPVIVSDPMKTEMVPFSDLWFRVETQTDHILVNAIASILFREGKVNKEIITGYSENPDQHFEMLSSFDLEKASQITGVRVDEISSGADIIAGKRPAFIIGHGILQQQNGSKSMDALYNLALLVESLGEGSPGFYFISTGNNEIGAWDMGMAPGLLPGRQPILNEQDKKFWEKAWKTKLSPDPGLNIINMVEEAVEGNIKGLYVMGENPVRSLPQPGHVRDAFENIEFLVVQDILDNETTGMADVVLPGAAFTEKAGSFTNMEGRVQCFEALVPPPGDARADWEILNLVAKKAGINGQYDSLEKIRAEIRDLIPMYSGLGEGGDDSWLQEHSRFTVFSPEGKGDPISFATFSEMENGSRDSDYPFKAIMGGLRYHLGSGTRTGASERITNMKGIYSGTDIGLSPEGEVKVSIQDGEKLNLTDGDRVRISSPFGYVEKNAILSNKLKAGTIMIPRAFDENNVRNLFALTTLEAEHSPGFKEVNVRIEKVLTQILQ